MSGACRPRVRGHPPTGLTRHRDGRNFLSAPRETPSGASGQTLRGLTVVRCTTRDRLETKAFGPGARARPLFENSTACRKSVPSSNPVPRACKGSRWGFLWLIDIESVQFSVLSRDQIIYGEFDPGSGRTLAACLTHASRARPLLREGVLAANG